MNNFINIDPAQPAPGIQGLSGKAVSQRDSSALFSAVLMQRMNLMVGNGADEMGSAMDPTADLGQGFAGNADLTKLLPGLLAQLKDSKSAMPTNAQIEGALDGSETNPALAIWIASILAAQTQPNAQSPALQLSGLSAQLSGAGTEQSSALQALEQQFPGLVQALKDNRIAAAKPQAGKVDVEPSNFNTKAANLDAKTPNVDTKAANLDPKVTNLDTKVPVPAAKNDFAAVLNAVHPSEPGKPDLSQPPAHLHLGVDATLADVKPSGVSDKAPDKVLVEQKGLVTNPAGKGQQEMILTAPQSKGADAGPQGQDNSQPDQSRSGSQTKKDNSSQQLQPTGQANSSSGAAMPSIEQSSIAAVVQSTHDGSANSSNHPSSSTEGQPLNLRGVESAAPVEATPRIVHAARLMEAAGQAEMRVSVKTESSGTVDVRALLEGDHISATVAAQHSGTRDWLMANIHDLQTSLSRDDLNLRTFEVTDSALQNNGHGSEPRQQDQQQQRNPDYSRFAGESRSITTSFDDMDLHENASRALSLLA